MREGWTYKKLGEVATIICGQDYKSVVDPNGDYPIYGTGGIMGYASQYRCPSNSVIIGRKGNINNPIFVDTDFWNVDTAFGIVADKDRLIPKFFYYFAINYDFTKHDVSVTIPSLRRTDLLKISIPIPPLTEQERIVSELDLLQSIIEKKKEQLKTYDQLAQSIFYDMFGDPIENSKGWEVKKLGEVCYIGLGFTHTPTYVEEGVPFLSVKDISGGEIDFSDIKYVSEQEYESAPKGAKPQRGDILFCRVGTMGKPVIIETDIKFCTFVSLGYLSIISKELINVYVKYWMLSDSFTIQVAANVKGLAIKNLNTGWLKFFSIQLPPLSLQQSFAEKIESIEKQKSLIQQSIVETQTMFDFTMDKYFG